MAHSPETKEFKRASNQIMMWELLSISSLLLSIGYAFLYILNLILWSKEEIPLFDAWVAAIWPGFAVAWLALFVFFLRSFLWSKGTPYIRITRDEVMVFEVMLRKPRFIAWDLVCQVNSTKKKKVELLLSNGKKVKIKLSLLDKRDREKLVSTLIEHFEQRDKHRHYGSV